MDVDYLRSMLWQMYYDGIKKYPEYKSFAPVLSDFGPNYYRESIFQNSLCCLISGWEEIEDETCVNCCDSEILNKINNSREAFILLPHQIDNFCKEDFLHKSSSIVCKCKEDSICKTVYKLGCLVFDTFFPPQYFYTHESTE